jgi:hypothetical protein
MNNSIFGIGSLNSRDFWSLVRSSFYLSRSGEFENLLKILYIRVGTQALNDEATTSRTESGTLLKVPFER